MCSKIDIDIIGFDIDIIDFKKLLNLIPRIIVKILYVYQ